MDKKVRKKLAVIVSAVFVFSGLLLYSFYMKEPPEDFPTRQIDLFFSGDEGFLKAEKKRIRTGAREEEMALALNALIEGPSSLLPTIPVGTRLLGIRIKDNTASVDFSREISENHSGGSAGELATVYSIVNTVAMNFREIKNVQILIEGRTAETLAGHVAVSFPLKPDTSLMEGTGGRYGG